jgi:hypothetical protein
MNTKQIWNELYYAGDSDWDGGGDDDDDDQYSCTESRDKVSVASLYALCGDYREVTWEDYERLRKFSRKAETWTRYVLKKKDDS